MTETERRRKRRTVSCSLCKRRKIRCNRETPCSNCLRSRNGACVYENHASQPLRRLFDHGQTGETGLAGKPRESIPIDSSSNASRGSTAPSYPVTSHAASPKSASILTSQVSAYDVENMQNRIKQLEEQLAKATVNPIQPPVSTPGSDTVTTTSRIGGTFHVHNEIRSFDQPQVIPRSVTHKTRLFGQSHWVNGVTLFLEIPEMIELHFRGETSKAISGMQRCKSLARLIKFQRAPPWPSPPTADLPPKEVADELVDCYLRTTETVYRILHVPTFRRDYEALWVSDAEPDRAVLVQLKLVLAIGATTYDEQFSLRASAIRWVYEAQTWLSEPAFKPRLTVQSLQTSLLLLFAREAAGVGDELLWVSTGSLLRTAIYMGLHRDPAFLPKGTTFGAEMRRRLWNTILEVAVQSSLTSGGPPLISTSDFNTEPPSNFDDEQLVCEDPEPKSDDSFTQISVAIALRKTFPLRLAVTKFLNDLGSHGTYEQTLLMDAELRASHKTLCRTLQACNPTSEPSSTRFAVRVAEFLMNRYLLSLHVPFVGPSLHMSAYAFSRKVVIDNSLKIWYSVCSPSAISASHPGDGKSSLGLDDLARFATCGSGLFRTVAIQAALLIAVELRAQLQEEQETLVPITLRPDLVSVLGDAKAWCLRCIEAGETNIKGYLIVCAIEAQIEGLMQKLSKNEIPKLVVKAAEDAEELCLPILEEMVAQNHVEGSLGEIHQTSLDTPPEVMDDWGFMASSGLFDLGNTESMSWMLNDSIQGPSLW